MLLILEALFLGPALVTACILADGVLTAQRRTDRDAASVYPDLPGEPIEP